MDFRNCTFSFTIDPNPMPDLKTGMFGVMKNGMKFVVVNDTLVYQDGGYDFVRTFRDNGKSWYNTIEVLHGAKAFGCCDDTNIIWERNPDPRKARIKEIEKQIEELENELEKLEEELKK